MDGAVGSMDCASCHLSEPFLMYPTPECPDICPLRLKEESQAFGLILMSRGLFHLSKAFGTSPQESFVRSHQSFKRNALGQRRDSLSTALELISVSIHNESPCLTLWGRRDVINMSWWDGET
jgi:hypothetical protein